MFRSVEIVDLTGDDSSESEEGWVDEVDDASATLPPRGSTASRSSTAAATVGARSPSVEILSVRRRSPSDIDPDETAQNAAFPRDQSPAEPRGRDALLHRDLPRGDAAAVPINAPGGPRAAVSAEHRSFQETAARASIQSSKNFGAASDVLELIMFTDGSVRTRKDKAHGKYGGAAVAYDTGNAWTGRAIALGRLEGLDNKPIDSNEVEMSAIFAALALARSVRRPEQRRIAIVTDSVSCLCWLAGTSKPRKLAQTVVDGALAQAQDFSNEGIDVAFRWVKGHNGQRGNTIADKIAGFAAEQSAKGHTRHFDIPNVYAQFPELRRTSMVDNLQGRRHVVMPSMHRRPFLRSDAAQRHQRKEDVRLQRLRAARNGERGGFNPANLANLFEANDL